MKRILTLILVAALISTTMFVFSGCGGEAAAEMQHHAVARGDVEITIQASGVIMPIERREITAMVAGEVVYSPFEEGDAVRAGDVLYRIDDTDARLNVERTQTAVSRANLTAQTTNESIGQLRITAPASGTLTNFDLNVGDQIAAIQIGTVVDNDNLTVRIPFHAADADLISVGDSANVTSAQFMTSINGQVAHVLNSSTAGGMMRDVEISLVNPGAFEANMSVGATVHTALGSVMSSGSGQLRAGTTAAVVAEQPGRVERLYVREGQFVTRGQAIAQLSNTALTNQHGSNALNIQESALNLESQRRRLDDYTITSPIDGIVISKNRDVGDNVGVGAGMREILMVVADTSQMVFDIDVDEMEIARVEIGQSVIVTADALPGQEFEGTVTSVAAEGVAANGVTKFAVEITIAEPGDLLPGMNADANIVVESRQNVLRLPLAFVTGAGEHGMVVIRGEQESPRDDGLPAGYRRLHIQIGLNNGRFVEILGGLNDGDMVAMPQQQGGGNMMMQGGMPGMGGGGGGQMHVNPGGSGGQMVIRGQ